jgi:hypothetical protein
LRGLWPKTPTVTVTAPPQIMAKIAAPGPGVSFGISHVPSRLGRAPILRPGEAKARAKR